MDNFENHNILELFLNDDVQQLLDHFAGMLDLRVTFFSRFGLPIRRGKEMPNTAYCKFIQQNLGILTKPCGKKLPKLFSHYLMSAMPGCGKSLLRSLLAAALPDF